MKVIYISDFFSNEILGGCELNDAELINMLENNQINVVKKKSGEITKQFLDENNDFYIVSNFSNIPQEYLLLFNEKRYVIYEHDHKYLKNRNPGKCKNFVCHQDQIINYNFYKNAINIFCQSKFHKNIIYDNLKLPNIESVSGNLWSIKELEVIKNNSSLNKKELCSIMLSENIYKNTEGSINFCKNNNINYELIQSTNYYEFLYKLGSNKKFCFIPKLPETLSRVAVEAKMMNVNVITNKLVGAVYEDWFEYNGEKLVNHMFHKREEIYEKIIKTFG